jgi:acyl carrier protein
MAGKKLSRADIEKKTRETIAEKMGIVADEDGPLEKKIPLDFNLENDLGADSLDQTELVMAFEDAFGVELPDEEVDKVKTVRDVIDLIVKKLE